MKPLTFFPRLPFIANRPLRRTLMVLTLPVVLVESWINATIGLAFGFGIIWNTHLVDDIHDAQA